MSLSELFAKISALPEEQRAEVERIVDAIVQHKEPDADAWDTARSRQDKKPLKAGFFEGPVYMSDDFDEPLEDSLKIQNPEPGV